MDDQTPERQEAMPDYEGSLDHLGTLNQDGSEGASQQIANLIRTAIATGQLKAGEMLPSQARLASHYGVARETTKSALTQLRNEGLLQSWQGKGTFVRGARTAQEQDCWAELVEIQENTQRLKRELATLDRAITDFIGRRPEDRCPCSAGQERTEAADSMTTQDVSSNQPAGSQKTIVLQLAPLLMRAGLQVSVDRTGTVEVRNPLGARMTQEITLGDRDGVLTWFWVWSGPTRDAAPEYEPICPGLDVDEVARRVVNVLTVTEA